MKLVFWPPSNSKRFIFEDMIPKVNSKNICNRLVLFGVMLMKIYFLKNWVNNRCSWNQRFQIQTKWFRLIRKQKYRRPSWRKAKLLLCGEIWYEFWMRKKNHHLHQCPCTTLIWIENIHMFHLTDLPLLLYMMVHFICIQKKFIVHLSWKRFHLKGIRWFKKKIILPAIILKKYSMPSLQPL